MGEAILARLRRYQDVDFDVTVAEAGGGEIELMIDGCREPGDRRVQRLEEQFQALGSLALDGAVSRHIHDLDACNVIVAPGREAGQLALSRMVLGDFRLMIGALLPGDRARLAEEPRATWMP